MLRPGASEEVLAVVQDDVWLDRLAEYKRRKAAAHARGGPPSPAAAMAPPGPTVPGAKNWMPLGPSVVLDGQAQGLPPVGGRIAGLAVAPDGNTVYAASANGGVFRSDDAGVTWRALMDAFDTDPTEFASTSLACGAIAIDPADPDRVYVGTGEGDTYAMFNARIVNALPAYRGIGPIRSDDGGATWVTEPTAAGSPALAGKAFFALALHPGDRERVVGATSDGLFQRVVKPAGAEWLQRRPGVHSSVVVASAGSVTRFFAAEWGRGVWSSKDGTVWTPLGGGFPTTGVGRIALAVQPQNPNLVYAVVATPDDALRGVWRYDAPAGQWRPVSNPPVVFPSDGKQAGYDLAIAVDPVDENVLYLGGSYFDDDDMYPASIWRCQVTKSGASYRMTGTSIGVHAHADVHVLVHAPGDPDTLWVGCDGGAFVNRDPRASGVFKARNAGLSCLNTNFFAQHPTDPGVLFCGLQDNGTARASGGPIWQHVYWGDGGYALIDWSNPKQVLVFMNGNVARATDGGQTHESFRITASAKQKGWSTMTEPVAGPPYNPSSPADAKVVALGSGTTVYLSTDFGAKWNTEVALGCEGSVFSLAFASATRMYVGTTAGEVLRVDRLGAKWKAMRLHDVAAGPLGLRGLVADIAVDWRDTTGSSIYVAFGGHGDYRHVWHFDNTRWQARSGDAAGQRNLLDVEHNAIVVDPTSPDHIYVGADIGVWHSPDRGATWEPLPNGLPDAPVFDLQVHPTRRLLRAATHGRGLYEYALA